MTDKIVRIFRLGVVTLDGNVIALQNRTGGNARYRLPPDAVRRWREHLLSFPAPIGDPDRIPRRRP